MFAGDTPRRAARQSPDFDRARSRLYRNEFLQVNMRLKALAEIYIMIWQKLIRNREPRLGTRFQPVALERGRRAVAVAGRRAVPPVEEPRRVPRAYRGLTNSTRTRIYAYSSKSSKLRVKFVTLE